MSKTSAGLLMYRRRDHQLELFLVHPGGPFWAKKDAGSWSIPKGEYQGGDDPLQAARREFQEETGFQVEGEFRELNLVRQPGGKQVRAWAVEGDCDAGGIISNLFSMEWPPRSGRKAEFPEVDRAGWFSVEVSREKILKGQLPFIDELCQLLECEE
ncbi:MAG TPA: NUDIX domain-containing protein [Geomonas sp.]|nr:NUDIX domain-containing protein [Geomonas sp.]